MIWIELEEPLPHSNTSIPADLGMLKTDRKQTTQCYCQLTNGRAHNSSLLNTHFFYTGSRMDEQNGCAYINMQNQLE